MGFDASGGSGCIRDEGRFVAHLDFAGPGNPAHFASSQLLIGGLSWAVASDWSADAAVADVLVAAVEDLEVSHQPLLLPLQASVVVSYKKTTIRAC